jgi:hypothetical protein
MADQVLFVAFPTRPGVSHGDRLRCVVPTRRGRVKVATNAASLLNLNFNLLWCNALNLSERITHWSMQHDDIVPCPGWADILIEEMDRHNADFVSAVVPLKDERGVTSTGLRDWTKGTVRRLTMTEIFALPETFGTRDIPGARPDEMLVGNTGLWIVRWGDWCYPPVFPGFRCADMIGQLPDGSYKAGCLSEDWMFWEWASRKGLKGVVTRKVPLAHVAGEVEYRNDRAWGTWTTDLGD